MSPQPGRSAVVRPARITPAATAAAVGVASATGVGHQHRTIGFVVHDVFGKVDDYFGQCVRYFASYIVPQYLAIPLKDVDISGQMGARNASDDPVGAEDVAISSDCKVWTRFFCEYPNTGRYQKCTRRLERDV